MAEFKFSVLADNFAAIPGVKGEFGFSILMESPEFNVLFDTGTDHGIFMQNASALGIELFGTDAIVISHGHYDHTSGIAPALRIAHSAKLFIRKEAADLKCSRRLSGIEYIGLPDDSIKAIENAEKDERLQYLEEDCLELSPGIKAFRTGPRTEYPPDWPFFIDKGGDFDRDDFSDETALLVEGDSSAAIISGCAHCGLIPLYEKAATISKVPIKYLIGGTHLEKVPIPAIKAASEFFVNKDIKLYCGHCTGMNGYAYLKMNSELALHPLGAGAQFSIEL